MMLPCRIFTQVLFVRHRLVFNAYGGNGANSNSVNSNIL